MSKKNNKKVEQHEDEIELVNSEVVEEPEEVAEVDQSEENEINLLNEKVKELEDNLLRERAEVENYKRRMKQEYDTNLKFSNQSLIENMLPVLDSFDRALEVNDDATDEVKQFLKGVEMIRALLVQTLEAEGLSVIPGKGEAFDPYVHQAVLKEYDEKEPDEIILDELQKGYKLKDRVLRASMVKVNSAE